MKNMTQIILCIAIAFLAAVTMTLTVLLVRCNAAGYDPDVDYMELMIDCVLNDDIVSGREYAECRNRKIDDMNIDTPKIMFDDLYYLSKGIYSEAGSYWITDEFQRMVGSVILNRVASPEYPNTIYEVLTQHGQYSAWKKPDASFRIKADDRTVKNAKILLEEGSVLPCYVIFQANFKQGSEVFASVEVDKLGTTYFCVSNKPELYEKNKIFVKP